MTKRTWLYLLILIVIVAIPLFAHLDSMPMSEWDEAHVGVNAMEMAHNHQWLIPTFNGQPEMWETKPPLMNWLQVICIKFFGATELAMRLPSALAALATCLILFFFIVKKYKEPLLGLVAVGVLATSTGYLFGHTARSGEYDSVLAFFTTGYVFFYFLYLEEGRRRDIYATFAFLIMASLTKGVQALLFLPALFLYTLYKKQLMLILKKKELYIGIAAFLFFVIGYYLLREHYNPGYIDDVLHSDFGRYNIALDRHEGDGLAYYNDMVNNGYNHWFFFVIPGFVFCLVGRRGWLKNMAVFFTISVVTYLLIVSNAQTKIPWYEMPLYPLLAILVAAFIQGFLEFIKEKAAMRKSRYYLAACFVLFYFFFTPYDQMLGMALRKPEGNGSNQETKNMEMLLQDVLHHRANIDGCTVVYPVPGQLWFYFTAINYDAKHLNIIQQKDLAPNTTVITADSALEKYIEREFNTDTLPGADRVMMYKLHERKTL